MELVAGYKQTGIGIIPNEWMVGSFGELFEFQNGVNADKSAYGTGVRFINVLEVITNAHLYHDNIPGRVKLPKRLIAAFAVKFGDVLFNRTSETLDEVAISSVYIDSEAVVFGGFVIRGRPRTDALDPIFSGYVLRTPMVRAQIVKMGQGAVRANVGQKDLSKVLAPLPPLPEQRAIAAALGDVDALIASLDAQISKKRDLKQAAVEQLLTGKNRLPGFKGEWQESSVQQHATLFAGGTPSTRISSYWGGSVPWMSSGELHQKYVTSVRGRITQIGLENSAATWVPINSVLVGLAGQGKTRGTVAISRIKLTTNQSIAAIVPDKNLSPEFLFHNLDSRYEELRDLSSGDGGRGGLNLKIIGKLGLLLPASKLEQDAVAAVLTEMDADLLAVQAKREKARALKQGMMQGLLTGRIRLI